MAESDDPHKYCGHCKRSDIPVQNFDIHVVHCRRNTVSCPQCGILLPRALLEEHHETTHAALPCSHCGELVAASLFEAHETNTCPVRQLECCYCQLGFARQDLAAHLDYCGSRTERCSACSRFVMLRDMLRHEESSCSYPAAAAGAANPAARVAAGAGADMEFSLTQAWKAARDHGSSGSVPVWEDDLSATGVIPGNFIPCEFCHRSFDPGEIMDHQSLCSEALLGRSPTPATVSTSALANGIGNRQTDLSSMFGGLRMSAAAAAADACDSGINNDYAFFEDSIAADMIPCEFCSACLPMDLLPHHQDVCARLPLSLRRTSPGAADASLSRERRATGRAAAASPSLTKRAGGASPLHSPSVPARDRQQSHFKAKRPLEPRLRSEPGASLLGRTRDLEQLADASRPNSGRKFHGHAPTGHAALREAAGVTARRAVLLGHAADIRQAPEITLNQQVLGDTVTSHRGLTTAQPTNVNDTTATTTHRMAAQLKAGPVLGRTRPIRAHGGVPIKVTLPAQAVTSSMVLTPTVQRVRQVPVPGAEPNLLQPGVSRQPRSRATVDAPRQMATSSATNSHPAAVSRLGVGVLGLAEQRADHSKGSAAPVRAALLLRPPKKV